MMVLKQKFLNDVTKSLKRSFMMILKQFEKSQNDGTKKSFYNDGTKNVLESSSMMILKRFHNMMVSKQLKSL